MALMPLFKRRDPSAAAGVASPDAVLQARARARRRLIGAAVLLGLGVVGFPLLFENQPRPIPIDIPIEIPRKEAVPALVLPPSRQDPVPQARPSPAPSPEPAPAASPTDVPAKSATTPAARPAAASAGTASVPPQEAKATRQTAAPAARPDDGRRAQALLEGRSPAAPKAADEPAVRVVVQVGAYSEPDKLREARSKVEQLGLKTYTQVIETDGTRRTRVRVGPFASRDDAEKAAARIKAAGLPTAILTL